MAFVWLAAPAPCVAAAALSVLEVLAVAAALFEEDVDDADFELAEDAELDDAEDDDEEDADESDAEELVVEMVIPPLEVLSALLLEEPGFSMNMASATIAASTAIAAMTKTTMPPPPRLGVGSNCFTLRGVVPVPAALPAIWP